MKIHVVSKEIPYEGLCAPHKAFLSLEEARTWVGDETLWEITELAIERASATEGELLG